MGTGSANRECRGGSKSAGISTGISESGVSALLRQSAAGLLKSLRFHLPFFSLLFVAVYHHRLSDVCYMFPNIDDISIKHVGVVHSRI